MVTKQVYVERECIGLQMVIKKQQARLEKQDKVIDAMAKAFKQDDIRSVEEIKQYFKRKVEEE